MGAVRLRRQLLATKAFMNHVSSSAASGDHYRLESDDKSTFSPPRLRKKTRMRPNGDKIEEGGGGNREREREEVTRRGRHQQSPNHRPSHQRS
jgi:hypothetical protein